MNLHGIVSGAVGAINPPAQLTIRVSTGYATAANGARTSTYATPGVLVASIAGQVLTASAVSSGVLGTRQTLSDAPAGLILPGTTITGQLSGAPGGVGTYSVDQAQDVTEEAMATALTVAGQVQAMSFGDLRQVEKLNLQGIRRAIYVSGTIDGLVRPDNKGGDLITLPDGTVWLVAMVLEYWPDWTKVAATQQDGS